jgi:peroxiredoxin
MLATLFALSLSAVAQDGTPAPAAPAPAEALVAAPEVYVGHVAPLFTLGALNDGVATNLVGSTTVALSDFVGMRPKVASKAVVVAFVRRADGDAALQELARVHKRFNKRGVEVVAIVAGGLPIAEASAWTQKLDLPFPVLFDTFNVVTGRYGVASWPLTVVVDGYDAQLPGKRSGKGETYDDSGDILSLGAGAAALAADVDVILEELVSAP